VAEDRVTQEFIEAGSRVAPPANNSRLTQTFVEAGSRVSPPANNARVTQEFIEVGFSVKRNYRLPAAHIMGGRII
jgi:hypothetical protein